jgi:DNA helicase-2/ATP-dependent DNA helicase PcrA
LGKKVVAQRFAEPMARVEQRMGPGALDRLGAAFVGTIHAYCFRLQQYYVPRYETFNVLDERRLTAFLCREESAPGLLRSRPPRGVSRSKPPTSTTSKRPTASPRTSPPLQSRQPRRQ